MSRGKSRLSRLFSSAGALLVDASDPAFGSVVGRLPGIVDLDEIAAMRPVPPRRLPPEFATVGRHVETVNRMLTAAGLPPNFVVPCLGRVDGGVRDVDLEGLSSGRGTRLPVRFVAWDVRSEDLGPSADRRGRRPLSAYLTLLELIEKSEFLSAYGPHLRRAASLIVLEESSR